MLNGRIKVRVSREACAAIAETLRRHVIPADREESELLHLPRELVPNFYFYLVGICHQTSPKGLPSAEGVVGGKHRIGWDFLWSKFEEECGRNPDRLNPESWAKETQVSFAAMFTDAKLGFRLTDLEGRVQLIRDMGLRLVSTHTPNVHALYEQCEGRIHRGSPNLLAELSRFKAYQDPVEKKSIFFLSLMRNTGIWKLKHPEALEAPVDYHEVRGHLRIGTVEIVDKELLQAVHLQKFVSEEDDVSIRSATRQAIRIISDGAGITPSQAHYLFWNIFRSVCVRDNPKCQSAKAKAALPPLYQELARNGCPFALHCRAFADHDYPIEHQVHTQYY